MLPGRRPGGAGHQVTHQLRFLLKWRDGEALPAYGAAEAGRDYNTVDLSERRLREVYLPPFAAGIGAGAAAVMPAFNELNRVPATADPPHKAAFARGVTMILVGNVIVILSIRGLIHVMG